VTALARYWVRRSKDEGTSTGEEGDDVMGLRERALELAVILQGNECRDMRMMWRVRVIV